MIVFSSKKQKSEAEARAEILSSVALGSLAIRCGFDVCREVLKSSAKSPWVREKETRLVTSLITILNRRTLHDILLVLNSY